MELFIHLLKLPLVPSECQSQFWCQISIEVDDSNAGCDIQSAFFPFLFLLNNFKCSCKLERIFLLLLLKSRWSFTCETLKYLIASERRRLLYSKQQFKACRRALKWYGNVNASWCLETLALMVWEALKLKHFYFHYWYAEAFLVVFNYCALEDCVFFVVVFVTEMHMAVILLQLQRFNPSRTWNVSHVAEQVFLFQLIICHEKHLFTTF